MNRREFVTTTAAATVAAAAFCACGVELAPAAEPAQRPGGGAPAPGQPSPGAGGSKVDAGLVSQYAKDGIWDNLAKPSKVLIVRAGDKIYAPTATCTHRACTVRLKSPGQLACPCHGSKFGTDGKPTGGPARAPLLRYAVSINDQKHLIVDKTKQFGEKEWDKDEAFVKA